MKLQYFIMLPFLCLSLQIFAQKNTVLPKGYVESKLPDRDEWFELNSSINDCEVTIENDSLKVGNFKYSKEKEIENYGGKIIAIDRGEWGGSLTFKPNSKKLKEIEIKKGNISFLFTLNNKIFFMEGLSHMNIDEGAFYELIFNDGIFSYKKIFDFEDAPQAMTVFEDKIFVASSSSFYIVENMKKRIIFKDSFWGGLYPNSIVLEDQNNIFVGIRGGFVKLNLQENNLKFYKAKP